MNTRFASLCLVFMFAGCASTPSPTPAPQPPTATEDGRVKLNFGWKAGDRASVTERRERSFATKEESRRLSQVDASWRVEVEEAEGGLAIFNRGMTLSGGEPAAARMAETLAAIAERSPLVVGAQGEPLRLEGTAEAAAALEDWLNRTIPAAQRTPELLATLRAQFSPEAIEAREIQAWMPMVAYWSGAELEVGVEYSDPDTSAGATHFAALGHVPCSDDATEARCIELALITRAPESALEAAGAQLTPVIRSLLPGAAFSFTGLLEDARLIAEPGTLRPHRYERQRIVTVAIEQDGEPMNHTISDRTVREFRWADGTL